MTILPPGGIGAEATYVRDFPSRKRTSVVNIFYNSRKIVNLTSKKFAKGLHNATSKNQYIGLLI